MSDESDEQTQKTPRGVEIPVPTREAFLRDLRKVAEPTKPEDDEPHHRHSGS